MILLIKTIIASLFNSKAERLADQSNRIFDVFTETIERLEEVNDQINNERINLDNQMAQLQVQKDTILNTLTKNNKIKGKIEEFIKN